MPVLLRRRDRKKAVELARLLVALDAMAGERRGRRLRRAPRLSLGAPSR
jgi:hypothetical protein